MKTFYLLAFTVLAFCFSASATIHTVNNNLSGPGTFTTIQAAHDAAAAGDTIYVASSPTAYGGVTFTKKVTLIGAGMRPAEKKDNSSSSVLNGNINLNGGSDNSSIIGIYFAGTSVVANNNVSNVQILRNYFSSGCNQVLFGGGSYSGWLIANNFMVQTCCCASSINGQNQTFTNILIQNNVFTDATGCGCGTFVIQGFPNTANCIFSNNLVYSDATNDAAFSMSNFIVENNIFHTAAPSGCTNCVMNNNITFGTTQDAIPYGTNTGANNVANTDPQLSTFNNATKTPFQNFQPAAGPAKTGGVGGTQMGVYGGSGFNWNNSAVPPIPQIKNFSITSGSTVPAGGSMTIKVTSTKQN